MAHHTSYLMTIANGIPMLNDSNWFLWKSQSLDFFISSKLCGIHPSFPNKPASSETDALKAWDDANLYLKPLLASSVVADQQLEP